jgi:uncharacterized protein YhdP
MPSDVLSRVRKGRRVLRRMLGIVGACVALLVLGAGLLTWRLSQGPLSLTFMTPPIERALSDEQARLSIKETILVRAGWRDNFEIRIRGVRMLLPDGRATLELPEMGIELSLRALLAHQLIAPASLEMIGARLVVVRAADGTWRFRGPGGSDAAPSAVPFVLDDLLAPPDPTTSLGYLTSASAVDSTVMIVDEGSGDTFVARNARLDVRRDDTGLAAEMASVLDLAGKSASVSATGHYAAATGTLNLAASFANLDPTSVATVVPQLSALSGVSIPLSGQVDLAFDSEFRLAQAGFHVTGENGHVTAASTGLPQDAVVRQVRLDGRLSGGLTALEIDHADIDLGGPAISLTGHVMSLDARPHATGTVVIHNVTADDVRRLWPTGVAPHARAWLTDNDVGGTLGEARADVAASAASLAGPWEIEQVQGTFRVSGAEVNYLTPLPYIRNVSAEGKFTRDRLDITIGGGSVGDLRLRAASLVLAGLDTDDPTAALDVPISGPLRRALELADSPPLGELKKAGLNPADFAGDMTLRLALKLPLRTDVSLDQVDVQATGRIQHLAARHAALGQDIKDGDIELRLDKAGVDIGGRVVLGPIPADFEFHRSFSPAAPVVSRAKAQVQLASAADIAAFGIDVSPYIDGPASIAAEYVERRGGRADMTVDAKLDDAALSAAQLGWHKPAGQPAVAHAAVRLEGGRVTEIPEFSLAAGAPASSGLVVRGRAALAADGQTLAKLDFKTLKVGLTDVHGAVSRSASGMSIVLAGHSLNVGPLMQGHTASAEAGGAPIKLDVRLDRLYSDADHWLAQLRFVGERGRERWQNAHLVAETTDQEKRPGHANVRLHTLHDGRQTLDVAVEDAGAFLDDLGLTSNLVGGRLEVRGSTDAARAGKPLAGHVHMTSYRVVGVPILARLLSVALLTGIVDSLTGPGIRFAQLDSDFAYFGPRIEIEDAHTAGATLGVSAAGTIDIDGDALALKGTIVPAYAINSLASKIPLIGTLLTGGARGMFATNYAVSGPMSSPQISVNAVSTLAPGFLRHLFGASAGRPPAESSP